MFIIDWFDSEAKEGFSIIKRCPVSIELILSSVFEPMSMIAQF